MTRTTSMRARLWSAGLIVCGVLLAGCTKPPGALELRIVPQQEVFTPGVPIRFDATFTARGGTLCLPAHQANGFAIELTPADNSATLKSHGIAECGTDVRMLVAPLLYPFAVTACLLDVADGLGRFLVLPDGQSKTLHLELVPSGTAFVVLDTDGPEYHRWGPKTSPLPPGRYHVRARFKGDAPDVYPAPLFWTVGDHSAMAETEFVIGEPTAATSPSTASIEPPATAPHYPAHWWTPVPEAEAASWEILPQAAGPGEVILSKRNELGLLSNFAATPFEFHGRRYAGLEGFWQAMKYPEDAADPRTAAPDLTWPHTRDEVAAMTGHEAKAAGDVGSANMRTLGIDWVTFEGRRMTYHTSEKGEHYALIVEATWAKVRQNPEVRQVLLATGDLRLRPDHHQPADAPPAWRYYDILMEIRTELQQGRE